MIVTVIKTKRGHSLIEWVSRDGTPRRSFVPAENVETGVDGQQTVEHPERGVMFGLDFSRIIEPITIDPDAIDRELKLAGLWSAEDVRNQPQVAQGAIIRALGPVLNNLLVNLKGIDQDATS